MDTLDALTEQQDELAGLLHRRPDDDWHLPTPMCPGWDVADVVLHLAQTNEAAIASAQGRLADFGERLAGAQGDASNVDDTADQMVMAQRGAPVAELHDRWRKGVDELRTVLAESDPHTRVMWVAGELSIRTLGTTRLAETWIHTNDVADAFGVTLVAGDRLRHVARLAWRTLPYAFAQAGRELSGPVAFELRGPTGEAWNFVPDETPRTTIRGDGVELCLVAGRRLTPTDTGLQGEGPDADAVLELVRTYAL
jgi:uncharacterized protein (TIGR03084 family)